MFIRDNMWMCFRWQKQKEIEAAKLRVKLNAPAASSASYQVVLDGEGDYKNIVSNNVSLAGHHLVQTVLVSGRPDTGEQCCVQSRTCSSPAGVLGVQKVIYLVCVIFTIFSCSPLTKTLVNIFVSVVASPPLELPSHILSWLASCFGKNNNLQQVSETAACDCA